MVCWRQNKQFQLVWHGTSTRSSHVSDSDALRESAASVIKRGFGNVQKELDLPTATTSLVSLPCRQAAHACREGSEPHVPPRNSSLHGPMNRFRIAPLVAYPMDRLPVVLGRENKLAAAP